MKVGRNSQLMTVIVITSVDGQIDGESKMAIDLTVNDCGRFTVSFLFCLKHIGFISVYQKICYT